MNQRGAAMTYALLAVAVGSAAVAYMAKIMVDQQKETKTYQRQMERDAIARRIGDAIVNPLTILRSAIDGRNLPGNNVLFACLGNPTYPRPGSPTSTVQTTLSGGTIGGSGCTIPNRTTGMEFLLIPDAPVWLPNCTAGQRALPANLRPLSCFLAGLRTNQRIAYDFLGDVSTNVVSQAAPLEARVYFRPTCRLNNPGQLNCQFAESFEFRYELQQRVQVPNYMTLGTYPTTAQWITMSTSTIVETKCNTGAIVTQNAVTSAFECQCYPPYVEETRGGRPVYNAQGPVCVNRKACPTGSVQRGKDRNGDPVCGLMNMIVAQVPGTRFSTDDGGTHSCNANRDGSWTSNIRRSCKSEFRLEYQQCPTGCSRQWWPILVGVLAGIITALIAAITLTALSLIPLFGAIFVAPAAAARATLLFRAAVLGAVGGLLAYVFSQVDYDWLYLDKTNGHVPHVYCDVTMECSNISTTPPPLP